MRSSARELATRGDNRECLALREQTAVAERGDAGARSMSGILWVCCAPKDLPQEANASTSLVAPWIVCYHVATREPGYLQEGRM